VRHEKAIKIDSFVSTELVNPTGIALH